MAQGGSQVMQQRRLRAELRRLREAAGHTQKAAAAGLDWSTSKIIRIETGAVNVSSSDVRAMLHFYGVSDLAKTDDLLAITRAKEEAWWDGYRSVYRQAFLDYIAYEDSAARIRQFISLVVPGLLQTEEYMRAVFLGLDHDQEWIEGAVEVRQLRQRILAPEHGRQAFFIIDEAALQRWIGGPTVIGAQLDHLRELAKQPNISIRLVPFSSGMHPGMVASFTLLEFTAEDEDTIVSIEGPQLDVLNRDDLATTSMFVETFASLEDIATPEDEFDAALDAVIDRMRLDTQ